MIGKLCLNVGLFNRSIRESTLGTGGSGHPTPRASHDLGWIGLSPTCVPAPAEMAKMCTINKLFVKVCVTFLTEVLNVFAFSPPKIFGAHVLLWGKGLHRALHSRPPGQPPKGGESAAPNPTYIVQHATRDLSDNCVDNPLLKWNQTDSPSCLPIWALSVNLPVCLSNCLSDLWWWRGQQGSKANNNWRRLTAREVTMSYDTWTENTHQPTHLHAHTNRQGSSNGHDKILQISTPTGKRKNVIGLKQNQQHGGRTTSMHIDQGRDKHSLWLLLKGKNNNECINTHTHSLNRQNIMKQCILINKINVFAKEQNVTHTSTYVTRSGAKGPLSAKVISQFFTDCESADCKLSNDV